MCSSRIERIQVAATCIGRRAAPRGLLLPQGRRESRRGVQRHDPAGTRLRGTTLRLPPQPSSCPGEGGGRGGQEGAPFHSLPGRRHTSRLRSHQDRRPSPPRPLASAAAPASVTTTTERDADPPGFSVTVGPNPRLFMFSSTSQSRPGRRGFPEPPLGRGSGRLQVRCAHSALSTRLTGAPSGAILTDPGALPGSIPTNQPETRTQ
jgi:hypothetical protein